MNNTETTTNTTTNTTESSETFPKRKRNRTRQNIKQRLLKVERPGMETLLEHMEAVGYYEAPAGCAGHYACKGGLAQLSWKVMQLMLKVNRSMGSPCAEESIVICALLQDFGKTGQFDKPLYVEKILKRSGQQSEVKPYERNRALLDEDTEERSLVELARFIQLTEEEQFAISHKTGADSSNTRISTLQNPATQLQALLSFANDYCTRFADETDIAA